MPMPRIVLVGALRPNPRRNRFAAAKPVPSRPPPSRAGGHPRRSRARSVRQAVELVGPAEASGRQRNHPIKKVIPKIQNQSTRTRRLFLRVSPEELAEIQTHVASAHLSFSSYARQRLLLQPVSTHPPEELHRLRRDLAGLCNNVNQIARSVHTNAREPCKAAEEAARYAREAYDLMRRWYQDGV